MHNCSMAKKIDEARRDLVKALKKHARLASDKKSSKGRVEGAAAKLRAASVRYGTIVAARTRTNSPFADIVDPRLDEPTVKSLEAERDALSGKRASDAKGASAPKTERQQ
jgi:hypothetical protein